MPEHTYLCLFDLHGYDVRVAPALRQYAHQYDPAGVVALLHDVIRRKPPGIEDYEHWADSLAPDAGHKPSDRTVQELSGMLIRQYCLPMQPQQIDVFIPWLSDSSPWFADLMNGGEELSGGSLEFPYGTGRLVATRQQIRQCREALAAAPQPPAPLRQSFASLRGLVAAADANRQYTLLLCHL